MGPRLALCSFILALAPIVHAGVIYDITITAEGVPTFQAAHTFSNFLELAGGSYTFTVADLLQDPTSAAPGVPSFFALSPLTLTMTSATDATIASFELDRGAAWYGISSPDPLVLLADADGSATVSGFSVNPFERFGTLTLTVTQDVSAIPEPATFLPIAMAAGLLFTLRRRGV